MVELSWSRWMLWMTASNTLLVSFINGHCSQAPMSIIQYLKFFGLTRQASNHMKQWSNSIVGSTTKGTFCWLGVAWSFRGALGVMPWGGGGSSRSSWWEFSSIVCNGGQPAQLFNFILRASQVPRVRSTQISDVYVKKKLLKCVFETSCWPGVRNRQQCSRTSNNH